MIGFLLVLFTLSGMCGLVYQLLWVRWLGLIVGNFATAVALVVTTFMGGLALGNEWLSRVASRRSPSRALALYGLLEAGLAGLAAVSPLFLASSSPLHPLVVRASAGPLGSVLLCAALLLPPTLLMGGTLPAVVQALSATSPRALGHLYCLNTLGGAAGPLLAAFLLLPRLGLQTTLWMTCALNALVAVGALALARIWRPHLYTSPGAGVISAASARSLADRTLPYWLPYLLAGLSGFLALGFEIALTRLFVLTVTGGSVYGFAIILGSFLFGLAAGSALLRLRPPRAASGALTAFALAQTVVWLFAISTQFWDLLPPLLVRIWWIPLPFGAFHAINFVVVLLLLLALTTAFGYSLPALAAAIPQATSASIGRLFAVNTVGAVLGAPLTGFVLLRLLGLHSTLLALGGAAVLAAGATAAYARPGHRQALLVVAPLLAALPFLLPEPDVSVMNAGMYNRPQDFRPGGGNPASTPADSARRQGRIIYQKDSLSARIAVRASSLMEMSLIVNGKPDGSTSLNDMYTQIMMAHLPALAHPDPRRALLIGLGTGVSTGSLALHPGIERIDVVEIEPAQVEVARIFSQRNYQVLDQEKVRVHLDDARHFLLSSAGTYDLIISGPSNLWLSGMVNLFTREFYLMARDRLGPGGVFFQWLHYYRVAPEDVQGVLRTFQAVFPETTLWINPFGDAFLLARREALKIDVEAWRERMSAAELADDLMRLELEPSALAGFFLWGPRDVERYSQSARLCTDDFPYLEFTTPRKRYAPGSTENARDLMQLFGPLDPMPLARDSSVLRLDLADRFAEAGSLRRAEAEYTRALELAPNSERARRGLERLAERERALRKALKLPAPQAGPAVASTGRLAEGSVARP